VAQIATFPFVYTPIYSKQLIKEKLTGISGVWGINRVWYGGIMS